MADLNITPASGDVPKQPAPATTAPGKIEIKAPAADPAGSSASSATGSPAPSAPEPTGKSAPTAPAAPVAPPMQTGGTSPSIDIKAGPVAPSAANAPKEDKSTFQNIFGKKDEKKEESKIISGVLKKKTAADNLKPILGHGPTLQKAIEQEKEIKMKKKLRLVQSVLLLVFVVAGLMAGYFYTSLSADFDLWQNQTAQLTDINKNIRSLQTQLNKYRYLAAQLDLNQFSFQADQFLDKVAQYHNPNATPAAKSMLAVGIDESQFQLPTLLKRIGDNLQGAITIEIFHSAAEKDITPDTEKTQAENSLRDALREDKTLIAKAEDSPQKVQDLRMIDNTVKIIGNSRLLNTIVKTSSDEFTELLEEYKSNPDPLKRITVQAQIADILSSTKSDIATISSLKNNRLDWLTVITRIETVTRGVDSNFGRGLYETLGGIIYTGYEFDSKSGKIVLNGQIKTNDATNFSNTSALIDALEDSEHFKDVEMRSFTKSGTPETGFTSNFKLDLNLELDGESGKNAPISLEPRKIAVKVKRAEETGNPAGDSAEQ